MNRRILQESLRVVTSVWGFFEYAAAHMQRIQKSISNETSNNKKPCALTITGFQIWLLELGLNQGPNRPGFRGGPLG